MGGGTIDMGAYARAATATIGKTTDEVFTSRHMKKELDPKGVLVRESRDSADSPEATPIIIGVDVTGSMGMLADKLVREGLGTLFTEILGRNPVTNPHLMFMAIGDANADQAPLQVSQFEADNRVVEQLLQVWLEGNGGGNGWESYNLPWYFAANHTSTDAFEKRGKKGYLFTMGDETCPPGLTPEQVKKVCGDELSETLSNEDLLAAVSRMYHVFHLIVEEGSHCRGGGLDSVMKSWSFMGQHVLRLSDYTKMPEVIISAIQITEGADVAAVTKSWKGDTALVVANATRGLTAAGAAATGAVTRF